MAEKKPVQQAVPTEAETDAHVDDLVNKALKALKSRSKSVSINSLENTEFASVEESTSKNDNYIFKKMKEILSDKEYRIVILHVLNGMSHKEIASLLHRPLGTITWAYSNAIKKLQKGLGDYYGK